MITKMELNFQIFKFFTLLWCVFVVLCLIIPGQSIDGFLILNIFLLFRLMFIILGLIIFTIKNKNKKMQYFSLNTNVKQLRLGEVSPRE